MVGEALIRTTQEARAALAKIENRIDEIFETIGFTNEEAMQEAMDLIETRSNDIVPVKSGKLKGSSFTEVEKDDENNVIGTVGYNKNGEAPYAVFVHEKVDNKHENGEAKFLEKAAIESEQDIRDIFVNAISKVLK